MNVITQGMPEEKVQFTFERMNGSQYEVRAVQPMAACLFWWFAMLCARWRC